MTGRLLGLTMVITTLTLGTLPGQVSLTQAKQTSIRPSAATCRLNLKDCRVIRTCRHRSVWKCRHGGLTADGTRRCLPVRQRKLVCRCRVVCRCPGQRPFAFSLICPDSG